MSGIQAIETQYKGHRFRSRLEARWAVFFDSIGIDWRYEHQGYETDGKRYLPDFELTMLDGNVYFVEVKGDKNAMVRDFQRYAALLDFGGCLPNFQDSATDNSTGLILLGEVPHVDEWGIFFHPVIQHRKGLVRSWLSFFPEGSYEICGTPGFLPFFCNLVTENALESSGEHWLIETRLVKTHFSNNRVRDAYSKARAARFEFGETPRARF